MIYLISDIHGEYELLLELLNKINFNEEDYLLCLGDMIDKGYKSLHVLNLFMSNSNMFSLMGNHEFEFLKEYHSYLDSPYNKIEEIIIKLNEHFSQEKLTFEMIKYLDNLPYYFESTNFIGVHAGVKLDSNKKVIPMIEQDHFVLLYDRKTKSPDLIINNSKTIIYGHTPTNYLHDKYHIIKYSRLQQETANINDYYKIHLDTGVYLTRVLGCLRIDDMQEFYVKKDLSI